jgi:hypothetical protein
MNLEKVLDLMHEQNKYAESKNASIVVLSGALLIGLISTYDKIPDLLIWIKPLVNIRFSLDYYKSYTLFICLFLIISMILNLIAFLPKILPSKKESNIRNIFHFQNNTLFSNHIELENYYKKRYKNRNREENDLYQQIFVVSRIEKRKYTYFKYSLLVLLFGPIISVFIAFIV